MVSLSDVQTCLTIIRELYNLREDMKGNWETHARLVPRAEIFSSFLLNLKLLFEDSKKKSPTFTAAQTSAMEMLKSTLQDIKEYLQSKFKKTLTGAITQAAFRTTLASC
jgi:hypothetical protein